MPYEKTTWVDQTVERQRTYNVVNNTDGTKTLVPAFGNVIQPGTPVDAEHLNKIEDGIEAAQQGVDALQAWAEQLDTEANVQAAEEMLEEVSQALEDIQEAIASVPSDWQVALATKADKDDVYPESTDSGDLLVVTDADAQQAAAVISDYGAYTPQVVVAGKNLWTGSASKSMSASDKTVSATFSARLPGYQYYVLMFQYDGANVSGTYECKFENNSLNGSITQSPGSGNTVSVSHYIPIYVVNPCKEITITMDLAGDQTGVVSNIMVVPSSVQDKSYEAYDGTAYTATGTPATAEPMMKSGVCVLYTGYGSIALTYRQEKFQRKDEAQAEHTEIDAKVSVVKNSVSELTDGFTGAVGSVSTPDAGQLIVVEDAVDSRLDSIELTPIQTGSGSPKPTNVRPFAAFGTNIISAALTGANMVKTGTVSSVVQARTTDAYTEFQLEQNIPAGTYRYSFKYSVSDIFSSTPVQATLSVKIGSVEVLSHTGLPDLEYTEVSGTVTLAAPATAVYVALTSASTNPRVGIRNFAIWPDSLGANADVSTHRIARPAIALPNDIGDLYFATIDIKNKQLIMPPQTLADYSDIEDTLAFEGSYIVSFSPPVSLTTNWQLFGCDSYTLMASNAVLTNNSIKQTDGVCYINDSRFTSLSAAKTVLEALAPHFLFVGTNNMSYYMMYDMPDVHMLNGINVLFNSIGNMHISYSASRVVALEGHFPEKGKLTVGTGAPSADYAVAVGRDTEASNEAAFASGRDTKASGKYSEASGRASKATADNAHAEGDHTEATGQSAHAEGSSTEASNLTAHAEGQSTVASGQHAHAEGYQTVASGMISHAEGNNCQATGTAAHAEGDFSVASGAYSHAEGGGTASGDIAHSEGRQSEASGLASHAEGDHTIANHLAQHVFGAYNVADPSTATANHRGTYIEIVGKGTGNNSRSNARTLDFSGNEELAGDLTIKKGLAGEKSMSDVASDVDMLTTAIAPEFSTSTTYYGGQYVWHDGTLYRFTIYHSAGAWDSGDVEAAVIADALVTVEDIKNSIAPDYDEDADFPIFKGQYYWHGRNLYVATTTINDEEDWTPAHWAEAQVLTDYIMGLQKKVPNPSYTNNTYHLTCTVSGGVPSYSWEASATMEEFKTYLGIT